MSEFDLDDYKIQDYVDDNFDDLPCNLVDFKRHLRADIALNKKSNMIANGRPEYAEYYQGEELIAKIYFEFVTTPSNLMLSRTEKLTYIKRDGSEGPLITIKHKEYDHSNLLDGSAVMFEREMARKSIMESIKAFLGGVLQQALTKTLPEVVLIIKPFWDEYAVHREDFVELGDHSFKDDVAAIDLATTPHTWLAIPIAEGVTVQDYIVNSLTY